MAAIKSRNNKILVWVLGLVLAGIWGEVGYRLILGGGSNDEDSQQESASLSVQIDKTGTSYDFDTDVRDPFSYRPEVQVAKKVIKPSAQIWVPPPLRLKGVIMRGSKRTAIVEGFDGRTFFESPGDTLYGVKILAVSSELVKYRYEKKDTSWSVGR